MKGTGSSYIWNESTAKGIWISHRAEKQNHWTGNLFLVLVIVQEDSNWIDLRFPIYLRRINWINCGNWVLCHRILHSYLLGQGICVILNTIFSIVLGKKYNHLQFFCYNTLWKKEILCSKLNTASNPGQIRQSPHTPPATLSNISAELKLLFNWTWVRYCEGLYAKKSGNKFLLQFKVVEDNI